MEKTHKTYSVDVVIGCTGGGFSFETDSIKEVEETVEEYRHDRINRITVWDSKINDFIFWKRALSFEPDTDMLHATNRDFRFKERHY